MTQARRLMAGFSAGDAIRHRERLHRPRWSLKPRLLGRWRSLAAKSATGGRRIGLDRWLDGGYVQPVRIPMAGSSGVPAGGTNGEPATHSAVIGRSRAVCMAEGARQLGYWPSEEAVQVGAAGSLADSPTGWDDRGLGRSKGTSAIGHRAQPGSSGVTRSRTRASDWATLPEPSTTRNRSGSADASAR